MRTGDGGCWKGWRRASCAALLGVSALVGGCGDGDDGAGLPTIVMTDNRYEPATLQIRAGDTVRFVNRGPKGNHTAKDDPTGTLDVSPQPGPTRHDGSEVNRATRAGFATHALFLDEAQRVVFPHAGEYAFQCSFHPEMTGTIEVLEPDEG